MKYHKKTWSVNSELLTWVILGKRRILASQTNVKGGEVMMGRNFFLREPRIDWMYVTLCFGVNPQWGFATLEGRKKRCPKHYKATGRRLMRYFYKDYPE